MLSNHPDVLGLAQKVRIGWAEIWREEKNKMIGITLLQIYLTSATFSDDECVFLIDIPSFISNETSNPCVHFSFNYFALNGGSLIFFYNKLSKFAICQCLRKHICTRNNLCNA